MSWALDDNEKNVQRCLIEKKEKNEEWKVFLTNQKYILGVKYIQPFLLKLSIVRQTHLDWLAFIIHFVIQCGKKKWFPNGIYAKPYSNKLG